MLKLSRLLLAAMLFSLPAAECLGSPRFGLSCPICRKVCGSAAGLASHRRTHREITDDHWVSLSPQAVPHPRRIVGKRKPSPTPRSNPGKRPRTSASRSSYQQEEPSPCARYLKLHQDDMNRMIPDHLGPELFDVLRKHKKVYVSLWCDPLAKWDARSRSLARLDESSLSTYGVKEADVVDNEYLFLLLDRVSAFWLAQVFSDSRRGFGLGLVDFSNEDWALAEGEQWIHMDSRKILKEESSVTTDPRPELAAPGQLADPTLAGLTDELGPVPDNLESFGVGPAMSGLGDLDDPFKCLEHLGIEYEAL